MAKFKKLALLCTALMMTASVTAIASCGKSDRPDSSSQEQSSVSSSVDESSSEEVASSEEVESSEDVASSEEEIESSDVVSSEEEIESSDAASSEEEIESSDVASSEEEIESSDVASSEEEPESSDVASSEEEIESSDVVSSEEEEPESSEDSSSEEPDDSSSVEPPVVEEVYYVNVVDGAASSLTAAEAWSEQWGTVTFNAPEAGRYAIYAVTDLTSYEASEVSFGPAGATDAWTECFARYTFDVAAAGEVTLSTYYYAYEAGTVNFNYFVYKLDSATLEGESGVVEGLAANVRNEIKFNAPAAGTYLITTNKEHNWYGSLASAQGADDTSVGTVYSVSVDQAGEVVVYAEWVDMNSEDYDFSYEIIAIEEPTLVLGENTVTLYNGVTMNVNFTAETADSYVFTINAGDVYATFTGDIWSEMTIQSTTEAGQKISLPTLYSEYEGATAVDVIITVEKLVEADPSALQLGANIFTASAAGTTVTFTAAEAGTYAFSNDDYALYEDGDEYGSYSKEVTLEAGQSVSYVVKYDGITTVTVEKIIPPIVLNMGETTINVAGAGCDIEVGDIPDGMYTLTWNNANVIITVNGAPFMSGSVIDYVAWWGCSIYAQTADGADVEGVVFTLAAFEYPTLALGDNVNIPVSASGTTYQFTATEPGNYSFAITGDVTWVSLGSDNAYTYPESLDAAGTIAIDVKAGAVIELYMEAAADTTVSVTVAYNTTINSLEASVAMNAEGTAPESLTIPSVKKGELVYYAASRMTGDYVLSWSVDYGNIIVYAGENVGTQYSDCSVRLTRTMMDGVVYLVVYNNSEADIENLVLNFATYEAPQAPETPKFVLGENSVSVEDAWTGVIMSYTSAEGGSFVLKAATNETNAWIDTMTFVESYASYDRDYAMISGAIFESHAFTLAAGETITFWVSTWDEMPGTVALVLEVAGTQPEVPEVPALPDDTNREKVAINLTVGQMTDAGTTNEYGKVYNLKQGQYYIDNNLGTSMADFQANVLANALIEGGEWIIFYLYNPTATEYQFHLAGGNNGWTDSQHFITLTPNAWTKVVITAEEIEMNKEAAWYMYILGGENDGAAQEGWQMSTVYAVMEEGWVRSNVLVDAATQTLTQGCYGGAIVVEKAVDELAGNVWNVTVGEVVEQAFHHDAIDTSYYASVYFYVYNPRATEMRLVIHGGWTDWGVATVMLAPKNWTKIALDMSVFSSDAAGQIFPVIQDPNAVSVAGEWKISSFYGLEAGETAPDITIEYPTYTIAEALALADDTKVCIENATVCTVNSAWSTQYNNMEVTVIDASGETLYVYRLATEVALGDVITLKGTMATYNEARQIAEGATAVVTGHDSSYDYQEMTITEALAAADGTNVIVTGTVVNIKAAWDSYYKNMELTIADDNGNTLFLYRLETQVALKDIITVKGCMATYNGARQIAAGATAEIIGTHTCSEYTEATCKVPASCVLCGEAKDDVLTGHSYVNGVCSVCGAQEGTTTVTASKTITELIDSEGWTSSTTKQEFKLDDVVTVKVDGGTNSGKAYTDHIRIYATDSPAGTLTISLADGYNLVSIKISTVTGTYAFLYVDGTTTDICNQSVAVSGSSVVLNSVKNGSNGKQVRVTAIEVVYAAPAAPAEPEEIKITNLSTDTPLNLTVGAGTYLTGSITLNGEYTFTWTNSDNANVTVKVNGEVITSGYKATYANEAVTIVIESSDNTVDVKVSLVITKTPDVVEPDEEWTKNY